MLVPVCNSDGVLCGGSSVPSAEGCLCRGDSHPNHRVGQTDRQCHAVPPLPTHCPQRPQVSQVSITINHHHSAHTIYTYHTAGREIVQASCTRVPPYEIRTIFFKLVNFLLGHKLGKFQYGSKVFIRCTSFPLRKFFGSVRQNIRIKIAIYCVWRFI